MGKCHHLMISIFHYIYSSDDLYRVLYGNLTLDKSHQTHVPTSSLFAYDANSPSLQNHQSQSEWLLSILMDH